MKIKVASKLKGKLNISCVPGNFRANDEIDFTKEQVESLDVQGFLNSGLLEFVDKKDEKFRTLTVECKNISRSLLMFSWGSNIRPTQVFFVTNEQSNSKEFKQFVEVGKISLVSKNVEIPIKNKTKEKEVKKSKTIKRISDNAEELSNKAYVVNPNNEKIIKETPKDVYVHNPVKDSNKIPIESPLFDIEEETGGIEFVDKKQAKERLLKTQKSVQMRQKVE